MSVVVAVTVALALTLGGTVDPTSARAVARRNLTLLGEAEAALAAGDGPRALERALALDLNDRRLPRARALLVRGRARAAAGLLDVALDDLRAGRAAVADDQSLRRTVTLEIAGHERARGAFDTCADELMAAGALSDDDAVLLATCLRGTARRALAHDAVAERTGDAARLLRARIRLEDGLPRLARDDVAALADVLAADDLLGFSRAFTAAGDADFARRLIDVAVARFPDDAGAARALVGAGPVGGADGATRTTRAALVADGLAGSLRDVDRPRDAWWATLGEDDDQRLRHRLAFLVDARDWERVWLLAPRLQARGLLDDDAAYAIAWAAFALRQLDDADAALGAMTSAAGFTRATELRAAIATCRAARHTEDEERRCPR